MTGKVAIIFVRLQKPEKNFVQADIVSVDEEGTELPSKIYLFQALPKEIGWKR